MREEKTKAPERASIYKKWLQENKELWYVKHRLPISLFFNIIFSALTTIVIVVMFT